jgi:hypothetical protein
MERIGALIQKLKEQFEQHADPAQMQLTLQMLQQELSQLHKNSGRTLGTSKVAVVMPAVNMLPEHEKYAPKPVEKEKQPAKEPDSHRVKETISTEKGSSVVQKNGQLDMVFDPMMEIPTLSHQPKQKEINDAGAQGESLNDKLKQGKIELADLLNESPIKDLRKAIGINDRFVFISELFRGDEAMYERSIKTINNFNIHAEAEYWIVRELKTKLGWDKNNTAVQLFDTLVKRRFS